jgi:hypothetical protein
MPDFRRPDSPFALVAALAGLLACMPAGATVAAGRTAASAPAAKAASAAVPAASRAAPRTFATREQLRGCLNDEDAMRDRLHKLDAAHVAHEHAIADLQAENAKIVEIQGQLDHESQTAVTAFNLLVSQHNVRTDELNKEASTMSAESQAFNAESLALSKRCSALAYRLEDMDAVMKERKAAGK